MHRGTSDSDVIGPIQPEKGQVAVIDDDAAFAALVADALALRGWRTVLLRNEDEVIACLKREPADVLLLDLRMRTPESGWSIMHRLDQDAQWCDLAVIVCSADRDQLRASADWFREHGVDVLEKPFELEALYRAVEAAYSRRAGAREH